MSSGMHCRASEHVTVRFRTLYSHRSGAPGQEVSAGQSDRKFRFDYGKVKENSNQLSSKQT